MSPFVPAFPFGGLIPEDRNRTPAGRAGIFARRLNKFCKTDMMETLYRMGGMREWTRWRGDVR